MTSAGAYGWKQPRIVCVSAAYMYTGEEHFSFHHSISSQEIWQPQSRVLSFTVRLHQTEKEPATSKIHYDEKQVCVRACVCD